ncbi:type VI secretion system ATPase TssH [Niveispirillum sp. KHB5.9]|uniref:type VI secretion system ATPase TssH n=1 Tax=Niveispirillum sp. KHB5.9 TaxID=3400269 RepID=UPI003A86E566
MTGITRAALLGKLTPLAYRCMEAASVAARLRGHRQVTLAHWLFQLLQCPDSDLHHILRHFEVNADLLAGDLTVAMDRQPHGNGQTMRMAEEVDLAVERAWLLASLTFGARSVRSGHVLAAIQQIGKLRSELADLSPQFERLAPDRLLSDMTVIAATSPEAEVPTREPETDASKAPASGSAVMGRQEALRRYSIDLTERARQGRIDPVVGRDAEIRQVVDVLMRRRQNNPILTGEAGVGKTAVVEGLALRIAAGEVPPALREVTLRVLDVGLLQAGAGMMGEFEDRLRQVIDEVQAAPRPVILFIDEAHTLIGAGGAAGTGDAANLLKPALARGDLRTIAATTWAEYKKYIEKDPALTRRFQVVKVDEPDEATAVAMLRGVAAALEAHHRVSVTEEALRAAVRLSHRYIPARQLPDKAVSLLDTAAARVAVSQHAVPAILDDCRRAIQRARDELALLTREHAEGVDRTDRLAVVNDALAVAEAEEAALTGRWQREAELVGDLAALRERLRALPADDPGRPGLLGERERLLADLTGQQGEAPLVLPVVNEQAVAAVVQDWTGIPVGRMVRDEAGTVLALAGTLKRRVIGQAHGLEMIARRVRTARAGLDNPDKPIGVFMLCGPSGVGKTETALALAEALYGGEQNLITINMSEFQEAHTVSTLKGAPPGYVGYGEGGVLTEAVRRRPYSVVLLDEVEKAHADVHEIFFQVFDKGVMEDGEGRRIDFRNTLILLTSNVGSELTMALCRDPTILPDPEEVARRLRAPLLEVFPAALLGRIVTVPYYPLSDAMLGAIVRLQLDRIARRVTERYGVPFTYSDDAVALVVGRCTELESGGRMIDAILTNGLLPEISGEFLRRMTEGVAMASVHVHVADGALAYQYGE